ncbi:MAG: NAD-dependent epimerase/dehydratase family protein [Rhodobacteraceae bacterium]|nr:NAD-dependent epimerase/dehydratase family protein [Paracoccaceae bacterium]
MIRWIIPERLGTGPASEARHEGAFRLDVRHLVDAAGNSAETVAALIDQGLSALQQGRIVLVVCDFGVSRSNAIAAGILSRFKSLPFDAALDNVIAATGEREIKLSMITTVRAAVERPVDAAPAQAIAVTGASGEIGQAVADHLGGAGRMMLGRADFDLLQAPALLASHLAAANVGCIIHLAHPRIFSNNSALGEALVLQKNVMDAAGAIGARFVLVSCSAVFGPGPSHEPVTTGTRRRPAGIVGTIKSLQEELFERAVENGTLGGSIIRTPPTYGPNAIRPRFIQSFAEAIRSGRPVMTHRFDDGPAALELLHLSDAARGIVAVAKRGQSAVYHLGARDVLKTADIAGQMARLLGKPLIHQETRLSGPGRNARLDWRETQGELGWQPLVAFEAGLSEIFAGLKSGSAAAKAPGQE